jgi:Arc/MetJ-type ribon-helix-helix transcriptional regulator
MSNENPMPKKRVCVTVKEDLVKWLEEKVEEGIFGSKSHGVERALILLKKQRALVEV